MARRSVILLLSFALVASLFVATNIVANETGIVNSTVKQAQAISYDGGVGNPVTIPGVGGCSAGCPAPGNSNSGGGVIQIDPNIDQTDYYGCSSVSGSGICNIGSTVVQDTKLYTTYLQCRLTNNGYVVAMGGSAAVNYLKYNSLGGIWNPGGAAERMFHHLTGYDLGWAPYPIDWSGVMSAYYNGTQNSSSEGPLTWACTIEVQSHDPVFVTRPASCAPKNDGRPFPYAVGYLVYLHNNNHTTVGREGYQNKDWRKVAGTCVYVSASTPPPMRADVLQKCYYGINHQGYFSTNRAAIAGGGATTTNRPVSPSQNAQQPYISGANSTARVVNCTETIRMDASLSLVDGYAYYRLQGNATEQKYQYYVWDTAYTGGQKLLAKIVPAGTGPVNKLVYGTNSCSNGASSWRQYPSHASLPAQGSIIFDYAECGRNKTWSCKIDFNPRINGTSNNVELMRDGKYVPLGLAGATVSGSGIRDINTKQVGTVAGNNMSYKVDVVSGSSPMNGTNSNDAKQYFALWSADQKTKNSFGSWAKDPNGNKSKFLTYYWSSDNGLNWKMTYQARIDKAEYSVPFQNSTTSGAGVQWKQSTSTVDCDGIKTSNTATILRSVSTK